MRGGHHRRSPIIAETPHRTRRIIVYNSAANDDRTSDMTQRQRRVTAAQFKAKCPRLLDAFALRRSPIVITKRGKPIAKLVSIDDARSDLFGRMAGSIKICGDIISPIDDLGWTGDAENI